MLNNEFIPGIVSITAGILMIVIRLQRWEWFSRHYKFQRIEEAFGEKGADIFFVLHGVGFIVLGVFLTWPSLP